MLDTLYGRVLTGVAVACALFAFIKGGEAERLGIGGYLLGWLASVLVQDDGQAYQAFQLRMFLLDVSIVFFFGFLVWRFHQTWTVWAIAIQLIVVMSHVVYLVDVRPSVGAFYTVLNMASLGILLCIAIGTFWAWQERRAAGLE